MIKSERYGGGLRWHCTNCDVQRYPATIMWWNSYPPSFCQKCAGNNAESRKKAALAAVTYLKERYQERAVFPGSVLAIADLCDKHHLVPNGMPKTHFAKLINETVGTAS